MARGRDAQVKIDGTELQELMRFYPSRKELADWFDVSESTIVRFINEQFQCDFDTLRDKNFIRTKMAIKRAQIKKALSGDNTMLIWCGKQYLDQRDKASTELSGPDGKPIETKSTLTDEQLDAAIKVKLAKVGEGGS